MGDHEARWFPLFKSEHYSDLSHTTLTGAKDLPEEVKGEDDILSFSRSRLYSWSLRSRKYDLHTGHATLLPAFQISISSNMDYLSPSVVSQKKSRETPEVGTHSRLQLSCTVVLFLWMQVFAQSVGWRARNCKAICISKVESSLETGCCSLAVA